MSFIIIIIIYGVERGKQGQNDALNNEVFKWIPDVNLKWK